MSRRLRAALALALLAPLPALAQPADAEICARAASEGRLGEMSPAQCTCLLAQGSRNMEPALVRIWKDALLTGESRIEELRALGRSEEELAAQMQATLAAARQTCGLANPYGY